MTGVIPSLCSRTGLSEESPLRRPDVSPSAQHDNPSKHAADFRDGFLLVEVPGDVVSQPALAEALVNEAESVLAGPFVFGRAFDCLAVPHNLRLAEILKS